MDAHNPARWLQYGAMGIESVGGHPRTAVIYNAPDESFRCAGAGLLCQGRHVVGVWSCYSPRSGPGVFIQTPGLIGLLAILPPRPDSRYALTRRRLTPAAQ